MVKLSTPLMLQIPSCAVTVAGVAEPPAKAFNKGCAPRPSLVKRILLVPVLPATGPSFKPPTGTVSTIPETACIVTSPLIPLLFKAETALSKLAKLLQVCPPGPMV